jgi:hypothetical protein
MITVDKFGAEWKEMGHKHVSKLLSGNAETPTGNFITDRRFVR